MSMLHSKVGPRSKIDRITRTVNRAVASLAGELNRKPVHPCTSDGRLPLRLSLFGPAVPVGAHAPVPATGAAAVTCSKNETIRVPAEELFEPAGSGVIF